MASSDVTDTHAEAMVIIPMTLQLMPDSAALSPVTTTTSSDVTDTNAEAMVIIPMTLQLMPDSAALSPVRDHPAWTAYSIVRARYMAPQTNHLIIPTEIVGFLNRPAN